MIYQHKIKLTEKEVYDILAEYLCQKDPVLKKAKNEEKIMSGGFQQIGFFGECLVVPTETFELMFELEDRDS